MDLSWEFAIPDTFICLCGCLTTLFHYLNCSLLSSWVSTTYNMALKLPPKSDILKNIWVVVVRVSTKGRQCYQSKRQGQIMGKRSRKRMAETRVNRRTALLKKFSSHFYQSGKRKEGCQPEKGESQEESRNWMASTKGSSYNKRIFKYMQQDGESKWITQNSRLERIKILECHVTAACLPLPKSKFTGSMLCCL